MDTDFVSEVDRKFFANNLLSNEDWEASLELSNMLEADDTIQTDDIMGGLTCHLPHDLSHDLSPDVPHDLQLPLDGLSYTHDDLLNDWSDSSDSGVSGLVAITDGIVSPTGEIKSEPLSPAFSHHSDSCDSGVSQLMDTSPSQYIYTLSDELIVESQPSPSYCLDLSTTGVSSTIVHQPSPQSPAPSPTQTTSLQLPVKTEDLPCLEDLPCQTIVSSPVSPGLQSPDAGSQSPRSGQCYTVSTQSELGTCANIHSIVNSKVKIQPRPEAVAECPVSRASSHSSPSQKSIVLSRDTFARLTNQGVLQLQPQKPEPRGALAPQIAPGHHPSQIRAPVNNCIFNMHQIPDDPGTKALKRQQRMIKNRESASVSRRKKKEYMSTLEDRLAQCGSENENLKRENDTLKRRLSELHTENESLKKTFLVSPAVKRTCLLALAIVFSLNLGSWSGIVFSNAPSVDQRLDVPVHKGRHLMSVSDPPPSDAWERYRGAATDRLRDIMMDFGSGLGVNNYTDLLNMCPTYFNRTESLRLADQLAGWMYRHEEEKKKVKKKQQTRHRDHKELRPLSAVRSAISGDLNKMDRKQIRSTEANYEIQLFDGVDTGKDFLRSIHRRNDTFYVLSFDSDYFLVPATAHNKTTRPRMSLVMPAVALNESMAPPAGHVGMMRIDCEVMNTQLIHVEKASIPKPMRDKHNTTFTKLHKDGRQYRP